MVIKTLAEMLAARKNDRNKGITFIKSEHEEHFISYKELYSRALSFLHALQDRGLRPGDEVVFQIDDNETFVTAFWACLLGGLVPAPVTVGNNNEHHLKVFNILGKLTKPCLIIPQKKFENLEHFAVEKKMIESFKKIQKNTILLEKLERTDKQGDIYRSLVSDTAYIQFSSGSTGNPKGVVLTHKNLITNIRAIKKNLKSPANGDTLLSWMPLTHDLGLILFHLTPITAGWNQFLMSPNLFIQRPLIWLKKISEHRATFTSSPNFGYKHLLKFFDPETCGSLDLSCLRLILNGAEPISADVCYEFLERLAPFGLKRTSMFPAYGLAEASLVVSFIEPGTEIAVVYVDRHHLNIGEKIIEKEKGSKNSVAFVEEGKPIDDCWVRIVDEQGIEVGDQVVGHIQIKGENVTSGYYADKEATAKIITADQWLDTGDLGFMRSGHLVMTARAKDVIFANGQNFYAHDLERLAEQVESAKSTKIAAAGIFNDKAREEEILLFVVFRRNDLKEFFPIANELKKYINGQTGLKIHHVIPVNTIPRTTSGKVRRFKLCQDYLNGKFDGKLAELNRLYLMQIERLSGLAPDRERILELILKRLNEIMGYIVTDLDGRLFEMGLDSIKVPQLQRSLEETFKTRLPVTLALDHPTVNKIADYIWQESNPLEKKKREYGPGGKKKKKSINSNEPIAVIGMACRFPGGADNPERFWDNLINGIDVVEEVPPGRWDVSAYYDPDPEARGKMITRYGGFLKNIDGFDCNFFKITPVEAQAMDPQQRLLLEVCWEASENAGLNANHLKDSSTGCFIGISSAEYMEQSAVSNETIGSYTYTGSMPSTASGRVSYFFGLQGPSMSIDTACSSSLVAIHQAILNLRNSDCNLAFAGGVNVILSPKGYIGFSRLNALAPDGRCKTFDDSADGYGRSEGCGIVVLKRLCDAKQDGDHILAVILGASVMHNGESSGLTVPNGAVQEKLIMDALHKAEVKPEYVDYIETHGSGTRLGDPQELNALANVFNNRNGRNKLYVGSVKTNIGHTESAAGIAGLIKVILALQKNKIPPHLHFKVPNRLIPWDKIPLAVTANDVEWKRNQAPRIAGVSSFGISGTNSHLVLRETPDADGDRSRISRPFHILSISAKKEEILQELAGLYIHYLSRTNHNIEDICGTANISRTAFSHRLAVVGKSKNDFIKRLSSYKRGLEQAGIYTSTSTAAKKTNAKIVFLFTGQGSQYTGMARDLYQGEPVFRQALDRCDQLFCDYTGESVTRLLYGGDIGDEELSQAVYAQPVIFSIQYSLARLWESWGVRPSALMGHSIGEYAAACIAGVFPLEEAARLVAIRGKLMQSVPRVGKMVGVLTGEENILPLLEGYRDSVSVAAVNAPQSTTISGNKEDVEQIIKKARDSRYFIEPLNISHPFHSVLMEPYVEQLRREIGNIAFSTPKIQIISTITGDTVRDEMSRVDYWSSHIRKTVRFYDAVKRVEEMGARIFVEIGGTATLSGLAAECVQDKQALFLPSLRKGNHPWRELSHSLAALYSIGVDIHWEHLNKPLNPGKVVLPNYPFKKESLWIKPTAAVEDSSVLPGPPMTQPPPFMNDEATAGKSTEDIGSGVKRIISIVSGLEPDEMEKEASFFTLGLDSLMLVQLRKKIAEKYSVDISLERFLMDLTTIENVSGYLREHVPEGGLEPLEIPPGPSREVHAYRVSEQQEWKDAKLKSRPKPDSLKFRPVKFEEDELTPRQKEFIETFIKRYNRRTAQSKAYLAENRRFFSHWLNSLNFRKSLKELVYPLTTDHAQGAYLWDLDGNKYVDLAMGYGVHYFGHRPDFVLEAVAEQTKKGFVLSPHSRLIGETARLICELTGVDRVTFCNTGSEAVMFAVRLARTVTRRDKIVRFAGSYHGIYDGVMAEADEYGTFPSSPGITPGAVEDVIMLSYGSPDSLEKIRALGQQLAGVLVEPVQSRRPGFQPKAFLKELRQITSEIGAALIFDEMLTGFRIHPGGAQHHFGVKADIVTYGKIIGGGMPIGIVAGKEGYLDAVDGGSWDFGGTSMPQKETTVIAGTFANHPVSIAAAHAVLKHLKNQGPALQETVNQRTRYFVQQVNRFFEEQKVPIRVKYFGSLFRFESYGKYDLALFPIEMDLFFYLMMEKGVYTWERRICIFSTVHSDEDVQYVINAVKESIRELRQGGFSFFSESQQPNRCPVLPAQKGYFILSQMKDYEKACHLTLAVILEGQLERDKLESTFRQLIQRHEAIRAGFEVKENEIRQRIHEPDAVESAIHYKTISMEEVDIFIDSFIRPFDLSSPPLVRVGVGEIADHRFLLVMDFHHIVSDGYSVNILVPEIIRLYSGENLPPVEMTYINYLNRWQTYLTSPGYQSHEKFWLEMLSGELPRIDLPIDFSRAAKSSYNGATIRSRIEKNKVKALKELAKNSDATLFMILLACFYVLLNKLTGQEDIFVGIPVSTRGEKGGEHTVGMFSNNLVLRSKPAQNKNFRVFLEELKGQWVQSYLNRAYPYENLAEAIETEKDLSRNPLFDVMFIYENANDRLLKLEKIECELYYFDTKISVFDLTLELIEQEGYLNVNIYYNTALFKNETIANWNGYFHRIVAEVLTNPQVIIGDTLKGIKIQRRTISQVHSKQLPTEPADIIPGSGSEMENQLMEIWKKELNLAQVRPNDNFFALGGRSFDTVRILSAINRQLGTQLSLLALFEYPTVSELASHIETVAPQPEEKAASTIPAAPPMDAYELSYAQMRYWSNIQLLSMSEIPGMEVTGDVGIFEGNLDKQALENALQYLYQRYDIFRTTYDERNSIPVQVIHKDMSIPFGYHDLSCFPLDQKDERLREYLLKEFNRKFDLRTGPLIRFNLFKIDSSRYIFYCNATHISFDGWSFSIIMENLVNFYNALISGETGTVSSPWPALRYVDYVMWHNRRIKNGQLDRQADYWNKYIMEKMPVAQLPPDLEEDAGQPEPSKILKLKIRESYVEKLRELAAGENTTLFVTMLAVLKIWIATLSNQTIITVGTVFSGRTYPELETIPGIMMNMLPLRSNLSGNPNCRQILRQTKEVVLEAYSNQDYPLELAAHKMRKKIDLNRDFYSIVFIGQEPLEETVKFNGINSRFCPLSDFIGCKNDEDNDFLDFPYKMAQDMLIEMVEEKQQITLMVRYNHRKFRSQTVKRYFTHFITLLEQFPDSMELRLSQLPPLEIDSFDELFASAGVMVSTPGEKEKFVEPGEFPG